MEDLNLNILIVTSNRNGLNKPIEKQKEVVWNKNK